MSNLKYQIAILLLLVCGSVMAGNKVKVQERVVYYPSVDQFGDTLTLSGKLCIPGSGKAKGVVLLPHYTITADKEAPSNKLTFEAKFLKDDYILVMPDYIGYGVTRDRIHPYLHGPLTAQNCLDLYDHVRPMIDSLGVASDSLYIVGVSQGAAVAMWTLKQIEEQYADRLHVISCFAGSGPYDVAVCYDEGMQTNYTFLPLTIAMLMVGTNAAYDLHLERDSFFTPAMKKAYTRYIEPKKMKITDIFFKMPNHKVNHWLTPSGMDKTHPETQRMYEGLLRSSLVHYPLDGDPHPSDSIVPEWIPQAPIYVFHSTKDDVVTFQSALHLQRYIGDRANITYDFDNYGGHLKSLYTFYAKIQSMLNVKKKQ